MKEPKAVQRGWGTKFTPYTGNMKTAQKTAPKPAAKSKIGGCTTCGKRK